jgi:Tfp pilus assembly protein PilF
MRPLPTTIIVMWMLETGLAVAQGLSAAMANEALRHYKAGVELMQAEKWDLAANKFMEAIAIDRLMALAHYNLGQCRMAERRCVEASLAYRASRDAYEQLSSLSQRDRDDRNRVRRDEINAMRDTLTRLPQGGPAAFEGAYRTWLEDRIRRLESMQNRGLDNNFEVPGEVFLALGSSYFRQNKLDDAEREWKTAVTVSPKLGEAHNNLAVVYMMKGMKSEAENSMKLAEKAGFKVNPQLKADIKKLNE